MSFGSKAKQVIATVAPMLGTVLGGPLGGLAGSALAEALGTSDPKAQEQAIIAANPDTLLKLKQAEDDLKTKLRQMDIDEEKLHLDDTANARAREIALKDWTPRIIAYGVIILTIAMEGSLLLFGQPKTVDGVILGRVLGTFDSALMLVLSYYYGSSAGSASKTDALNTIAITK